MIEFLEQNIEFEKSRLLQLKDVYSKEYKNKKVQLEDLRRHLKRLKNSVHSLAS